MQQVALSRDQQVVAFTPYPTRYLWWLLAMLMSATVFEGYDITIFHLCTPNIAKTFSLSDSAIGLIATIVRFGGILSFGVVMLADRYGRKPIISNTVILYGVLTLATALSSGMVTFTIFQSMAQVFLAAEFGVAVVMISEEFPDNLRGRGIAALHMVAFIGVIAAALAYAQMAETSWGWRGMYLLGIAPLVIVASLRRGLRETARFTALTEMLGGTPAAGQGLRQSMKAVIAPFSGPHRWRLLLIAAIWNSVGVIGGPTISFFSLYAQRNHHWKSHQVSHAIIAAYAMGTLGSAICGVLMDKVGRKLSACLFFIGSAVSMFVLFRSSEYWTILLSLMATMFCYQSARTATATLSAELFPTEIRCTCYSATVQVLGQLGWMLSPVIIGLLSVPMGGLGRAASIFSIGPLLGTVLLIAFAPETKGKTLEEICS